MALPRRPWLLLVALAVAAAGHAVDPLAADDAAGSSCEGTALIQKTVLKMEAASQPSAAPEALSLAEAQGQAVPRPFSDHPVYWLSDQDMALLSNEGPDGKNRTKKKFGSRFQFGGRKMESSEHDRILAAKGWWLNVARDGWILIGSTVGGILISVATVLVFVSSAVAWRADWLGRDLSLDAAGNIVKPEFPVGMLQQLFRVDLNPFFAYRADLAMRCALVCAMAGLSYLIPALSFMNSCGWTMQYVVVIVCFSVYMDLGNTVACAWYNFYGTLLPVINVMVMHGIAKGGCTGHSVGDATWWFGVVDFVVFIGIFLALKVPVGVRMFALSWQAYFSMCFLNPDDNTRFSHGFHDIILEGAAVGPLMGTIIGCVLAILTVCSSPLGWTLCGLGRAQEAAVTELWKEADLWKVMVTYYTGKEKLLEIQSLIGHANHLEQGVEEIDSMLSMTWWETFDIGRPGRVRAHLLELNKIIRLAHEWLKCILQSVADEDFNDQHDELMEKLAPAISDLTDHIGKLMFRGGKMAISGFSISSCRGAEAQLAKYEQEQLQADVAAVNGAQRRLAQEFVRVRKEVYGGDVITPDATGEHFFMFAVSVYGQYATDYAEYLIKDERKAPVSIFKGCYQGILDTLVFNEWDYILRSSLGFFGAFIIGYWGMNKGIMPSFSATAAGTTAYLLAAEGKVGSAISKNIARFQGTAGGTLLGQVLFKTLMTQTTFGQIAGFIAIVVFEFFAFYLYFSSPSYGYVGLLLAAYGAQHMLIDYGSESNSGGSIYMTLIDQSVAIICVLAADFLVGNESPGRLAATQLFDLSRDVRSVLDGFYSTSEERSKSLIRQHTKKDMAAAESTLLRGVGAAKVPIKDRDSLSMSLRSKYVGALDMGNEAALEPRFYRIPFKEAFWNNLTAASDGIVVRTCVMQSAMHLKGLNKFAEDVDKLVTSRPTFKKHVESMMERWSTVHYLSEQILLNETLAPLNVPDSLTRALGSAKVLDMEADMGKLVAEVNEVIRKSDPQSLQSCANEAMCLACVIIEMTSGIMKKVNAMEDACFQCHDVSISYDE